ncbi:hypothetical protein L218DRAFT_812213, partial [Marasmius fiardii PR-910]
IFGAVHCIAWNFFFPTDLDRLLWRIFAGLAAGLPLLFTGVHRKGLPDRLIPPITHIIFPVVAISYIVSRFGLIALALMGLRNLPETAYQTINWTTFIP